MLPKSGNLQTDFGQLLGKIAQNVAKEKRLWTCWNHYK